MPRFFVPPQEIHDNKFTLTGSEARHAALVLRKKVGDVIDLFDGKDLSYQGKIEFISSERVQGAILTERKSAPAVQIELQLYQALIKGPKWDWLVEKACEVGVSRLVPLLTERSIVRWTPSGHQTKIDRWQRIALAASKQCGRPDIMTVENPITLPMALQKLGAGALSLVAWEKEEKESLPHACAGSNAKRVNLFIGPEGGWDEPEVTKVVAAGVKPVHIGPTLLRAETAGLLTAILVLREFGAYA